MRVRMCMVWCLIVLVASAPGWVAARETATPVAGKTGLRGARYCEVLPVYRDGLKFRAEVWNSLGLNDCPEEQWRALDAKALAKQLGAVDVMLNGPRYWLVDEIVATGGVTAANKQRTFGEIAMTQRATVSLSLADLKNQNQPYVERAINRDTRYVFDAGKPVYTLTQPDGGVCIMQTWSQIVDPTLSMDDLATLGDRLKLPAGWKYAVVTPTSPVILDAAGTATVIQDDFTNTYQCLAAGDASPA